MDPLSQACYTAAKKVLIQVLGLSLDSKATEDQEQQGKLNANQTKFHCQEAYKAINDFLGAFKD